MVYGDTRNLRMAPHNAHYSLMLEHLRRANVKFESSDQQWFAEQVNNFRRPINLSRNDLPQESILPAVDFSKMVLPQGMTDAGGPQSILNQSTLLLCPRDYQEVLEMRLASFAKI